MTKFEILRGLPSYGPIACPFPEDGRGQFREGLAVKFWKKSGATWVGNFQRGFTSFDQVMNYPDGHLVIVIAGGDGYVIDPDLMKQTHKFGGGLTFAIELVDLNLVLIGDNIRVGTFTVDGPGWDSGRISWDGIRNIVVNGSSLSGEAYTPIDDCWQAFGIDLLTGEVTGAVYPEQMATAVKLRRASAEE
ncbi:MAG TPA: hypothetical protein VKQ27_13605 [Acetobacteraceae bacterium]|nr:hypothetical protein [Acetobacteraceae bacterium]